MLPRPPGAVPVATNSPNLAPSASREKGRGGGITQRDMGKEHWGNKIKGKNKNVVRLLLNNVNGIGQTKGGMKDELMRSYMTKWGVDIACITEPNVHWGKVKKGDDWYERSRGWFQSRRLAVAYHTERGRLSTVNQYGGTMTLARDDISHRAITSGYDKSGMGRWSFIRFRGKRKNVTRVITCYCPNRSINGPNTVYSQQLQSLNRDPINAFWDDLEGEIREYQEAGEQIVLLGDWNTDANDKKFIKWKSRLGLIDPIQKRHGKKGPGTFNRGKRVIDSILISSMLKATGCGYLSFGELPGDHRGLWIDICLNSFLGYRAPSVPSYQARRLKTDDPRVLAKYKEVLEDELIEAKVFSKLRVLQSAVQVAGKFLPVHKRKYEVIDAIRTEAMKKAEKKCRKLRMGCVEWSPALQSARDEILLWVLVRRKSLGRNVGARRILRLKKKLKITNTHVSIDQSSANIDKAFKRYKVLRRQAKRLRTTFLEDLAEARALEGNTSLATEIRNMTIRENQRTTARRIKSTLGKNHRTGTSKIEITEPNGTITEVTHPKQMVKHIIQENRSKYNQNGKCPLFAKKLMEDLGLLGDGPEIEKVLDGTYEPPPDTPWATRRWLQQMSIPDHQVQQEISTSLHDYRHGWKLAKERTASGELHMGHFKAGASHKRLGWFNFIMAVLPYSSGYVPQRWRKGTDVMILKKEGNFLLEKLRTIVLYEADFNTENKRLGRDAMKLAIAQNKIAKEQFSRPGRSAQENVVCKRLVFDYCRTRKTPYGMCSCDLKSCYDRIVHSAASIALRRIGVPVGKIKVMFGAVQKLVHHVRTLFGTSKESYGGENDTTYDLPPQGMGQGHGSGPTIWSILSSTIFEILHAEGFASDFIFSISKGLFHLCGFSYVDDCDLLFIGEDVHIVAEKLQSMLTLWEELMDVNGGAIAPDKCWWYLVDFKWRNGKWRMFNASTHRNLTVRDKDKKTWSLPSLDHSDAKEMLGVFLAPDGNQEIQLSHLSAKAKEWMEFVRVGGLDWGSTWVALKTTIWKSLEYPLPATSFSESEITSITGPLYKAVLPRCGYSGTFPRDVLHGPKELQGLGLDNLFDKQYIRHIKDILDYGHRKSTSGEIFQAAIEAIKVEAGLSGSFFTNRLKVNYLNTTNSWVADTRKYCLDNGISFDEKCGNLLPKRSGDKFLMEECIRAGLSTTELKSINRCRLYLQVYALSDISTGDGRFLSESSLNGQRSLCNSYAWPEQSTPPTCDWKIWRSSMRSVFAPTNNTLVAILGPWITKTRQEHFDEWEWWIHPAGKLLRRRNDKWIELESLADNRRYPQRSTTQEFTSSPLHPKILPADFTGDSCQRTTVRECRPNVYIHTGSVPVCDSSPWLLDWLHTQRGPHHSKPTDLQFLRKIDDPWITQYLHHSIPLEEIISLLVTGQLVGVSDGSFHPKRKTGSMAWCLATKDGFIVLKGGGLIPGHKSAQGSYRSEAGGLLALVTIIQQLEKASVHPISPYSMKLACDGESALYRSLTAGRERLNTSVKHADLLSRTHDRKDELTVDIDPVHVYGHRDDVAMNLTTLESLNVSMDKLAKAIALVGRRDKISCLDGLPDSSDGYPTVRVKGVVISSEIEKSIMKEVSGSRIKKWWIKKKRFRPVDARFIDWNCMAKCMSSCGHRYHRFIPKWVTGQIAVGKVMAMRKARAHNTCPRCNATLEDTAHVLRCQHDDAVHTWSEEMKKIKEWCLKVDTHPAIVSTLFPLLITWQSTPGYNHHISSTWPREVRSTYISQARLGWDSFLSGLLSTQWSSLQDGYYQSLGSRKLGSKWSSDLSKRLWQAVYAMWEHRNSVLHQTAKISEFSGRAELETACILELTLGPALLPVLFHPYFEISRTEFLTESLDYKRNWFAIIRQAREATGYIYSDLFVSCQSSRDWVGLEKPQCS